MSQISQSLALCVLIRPSWIIWLKQALGFSSYVLEIPKDAFTTLSQNLIGRSTLSQEYCKLIGLY